MATITLRKWQDLRAAVRLRNREDDPDILAPPEAFDDRAGSSELRA